MDFLYILTFFSILGCALVAGIFFAFSTFVMQALARLIPSQGIEAMQNINITVLNPWFLGTFMGTAAICLILAVSTYWNWDQPDTYYLLTGSLFYFVGTFLVTIIFNVPMNNKLESMVSKDEEASNYWNNIYLTKWTFWNHFRTIASLIGAILLIIALVK